MIRKALTPLIFGTLGTIGALGILAIAASFQHSALGNPDCGIGIPTTKVGHIEGLIEDTLAQSDAAVVFVKEIPIENSPAAKPSTMEIKKITFNPRILPVLVGTTLKCPNKDTITHNIFSPKKSAKSFNFGLYPPGSENEVLFNKVGVVPFRCNIHSEMAAYVVVLPNPYFAKTDNDGRFKIENIPPGKYQVSFWHEKLHPKTIAVEVTEQHTTKVKFSDLEKGKYSIELTK